MRKRSPKFFPSRLSSWVRLLPYVGGSEGQGVVAMNLGTPNAAAAGAILSATSIASVGSVTAAGLVLAPTADAQTEAIMGRFGRRLSVVASGAASSTVTLRGRDYLQQRIVNTVTLNGTTAVESTKAFRYLDDVPSWGTTAATTITIGTGAGLGLPYKSLALKDELRDNVLVTSGALVVGAAAGTQTATSADPRGIYTPSSAGDGSANLAVRCLIDTTDGYGAQHYGG